MIVVNLPKDEKDEGEAPVVEVDKGTEVATSVTKTNALANETRSF